MQSLPREGDPGQYKKIWRGWCLGDDAFRQELLDQMHEHLGGNHVGPGKSESAEQRAERILAGELKHLRWREGDLKNHRKGDPRKVRIAVRLRKESTVTLKWIARRLAMGTWSCLSNRLYWAEQEPNDRK